MKDWLRIFLEEIFFQRCSPYHNNKKYHSKQKYNSMSSFFSSQWLFTFRIILICFLWYGASSTQSIVNKMTLQVYAYPLTVTLSSLVNNAIYTIPLAKIMKVKYSTVTRPYLLKTLLPIAGLKAIALASAFFGLWKVPVSYAQTVKATLPIFTVFASRCLKHEPQRPAVYLSLLPIVAGVIIASFTEMSFNLAGLLSSLFSTFLHSFINVLIKKVFDDTQMHPITLLCVSSQLAAVILFPLWLLTDGVTLSNELIHGLKSGEQPPDFYFIFLLFAAGFVSFIQNLCAFALIHQLTTLSYAITNTTKRIAVIVISLVIFKNPVTPMNCFGMFLAVIGMFVYNRAKENEQGSPKFLRKRDSNNLTLKSSDSDARLLLSTTA
jgi:solute carrier family 35 protein E1